MRLIRLEVLPGQLLPLMAALALLQVVPASAHGASAGDLPLTPRSIHLKHLRPADAIALFGREAASEAGGAHAPRAVRAGSPEALLPAGIEALLRSGDADELVLVGAEDRLAVLRDCLQVLDVAQEPAMDGRVRAALTLRHASPREVLPALRHVPGGGSARAEGGRLVLEGPAPWLHQALREVIRGELGLKPVPGKGDSLQP